MKIQYIGGQPVPTAVETKHSEAETSFSHINTIQYIGEQPKRKTPKSAGLDLHCRSYFHDDGLLLCQTNVRLQMPSNLFGMIALRSSMIFRGFSLANGIGVVDADYQGEIIVALRGDGEVKLDERIAQIIFLPVPYVEFEEVSEFEKSERGGERNGGFGSTGRF